MPTYVDSREIIRAYHAGFFDGEGCISLSKNYNTLLRVVTVQIAQKEESLLEGMQDVYGGKIYWMGGCSTLVMNNIAALNFLKAVIPYLILRKKEALIAMEILKLTPSMGKHVDDKTKLIRFKLEDLLEKTATERRSSAEVNSGVRQKPVSTDH